MKRIPIGIENFKEMIDKEACYVDKTSFISNVLQEKFTLLTRPRRFGKTLTMSMLYYFFSNKEKANAYLFEGLNISKDSEAMAYQNQYPTLFLTLKDMKRTNYKGQLLKFRALISLCAKQYLELADSPCLLDSERLLYQQYIDGTSELEELEDALFNITYFLEKHFHQKAVLLIDEYDVPLQTAYSYGYYDDMAAFLKNVFSSVLKTNDSLEKGIMTGCLRISKESIFTGLNNFNVYSILDRGNSEYFGFTEKEVRQILSDYHLTDCFAEVREWYDGYLFGNTEIYNPWSTLQYVNRKLQGESSGALSFWANTSGNDIVYNYIQKGDRLLHNELERLMQGETIIKEIRPELTYRDMDKLSNIYSFLLFTGYLKITTEKGNHEYELVIPNKEVYEIYRQSFIDYFTDFTDDRRSALYHALADGNTEKANALLNEMLARSISYFDSQETFYHGFLVGLFSDKKVESNKESGCGRYDICIFPDTIMENAIIMECKHSSSEKELIRDADAGARQILDRDYFSGIIDRGYPQIIGYGISFYKKQCYIVKAV